MTRMIFTCIIAFSLNLGITEALEEEKIALASNNLITDEEITVYVRNAIIADTGLALYLVGVDITTDHGVVTLTGTVPNSRVRGGMEIKARGAPGVKRVINKMEVKG